MTAELPDADYVVLSSRLIPGLDGGYTVATLARARLLARAGAASPLLLSIDPGTPAEHVEHRRVFVERGDAAAVEQFRNLFDDALSNPTWLRDAAVPGAPAAGIDYREIADAEGKPLLALPVIANDPDWHLTDAPVLVHGYGVVTGFGGLYRAWLSHVVAQLRIPDPDRLVVIICESRQLGELIVGLDDPGVRIVHTIHNSHLEPPYDNPDGPINALWSRWFEVADRFDAVLWPTAAQRDDVEARFGALDTYSVVPNTVEDPGEPAAAASRDPRRVVMLNRLAPQKRVDRAIRAWERVVEAVPDARLDIYGDGPLRAELQSLIDARGLANSVRLCGHTDDSAAVLDTAALLLVSTAYEGQGLSIAESLVRGLPVVSFDVRYGPRETIGAGGVLVAPADEAALADAVSALLRDDDARAALSPLAVAAGRALTTDAVLPLFVKSLRSAVSRPRR